MDVFTGKRLKQSSIKFSANSLAHAFMATINRGFDSCVIGRFGAETRGAGVSQHQAIFFGHQQAVAPGQRKLLKPRCASLHRVRFNVKCNRRMDNVVVVNLRQSREIGTVRRTNRDAHGKQFLTFANTFYQRDLCFAESHRAQQAGDHRQAGSADQSGIAAEHSLGNHGAADRTAWRIAGLDIFRGRGGAIHKKISPTVSSISGANASQALETPPPITYMGKLKMFTMSAITVPSAFPTRSKIRRAPASPRMATSKIILQLNPTSSFSA